MYKYVGACTRAAEGSNLDQVLSRLEVPRAEAYFSERCSLDVPRLARFSRPYRGQRRSWSCRLCAGGARFFAFLVKISKLPIFTYRYENQSAMLSCKPTRGNIVACVPFECEVGGSNPAEAFHF